MIRGAVIFAVGFLSGVAYMLNELDKSKNEVARLQYDKVELEQQLAEVNRS